MYGGRSGSYNLMSLNSIDVWSKKWLVQFNASKSEDIIVTGSRRAPVQPLTLMLNGVAIPQVTSVKHLGIFLSSDLQWKDQLHHVIRKVSGSIGMLRRMRRRLPAIFVKTIYVSVIRPSLEYAAAVWGNLCQSDTWLLERVQLQVVNMLCPDNLAGSRPSLLLKHHDLPTLAWRRRQQRLVLLWKLLNGCGPPDLIDQLPPLQRHRISAAQYSLRRPYSVTQLRPRTAHEASSWLCQAITEWNQLLVSAQSATSLSTFKQLCCVSFSSDRFTFGVV